MADFPHLNSEIFYGHCVYLLLPDEDGTEYYLQNFQVDPYSFLGNSWEFLPFEASNVSNNLDLSNTSAQINIANISLIRSIIRSEIRNSRLTLYTIFPEDNDLYTRFSGIISGYSISKSVITVSVSSALDAITGTIPSTDFNPIDFPVLAYINLDRQGKIRN